MARSPRRSRSRRRSPSRNRRPARHSRSPRRETKRRSPSRRRSYSRKRRSRSRHVSAARENDVDKKRQQRDASPRDENAAVANRPKDKDAEKSSDKKKQQRDDGAKEEKTAATHGSDDGEQVPSKDKKEKKKEKKAEKALKKAKKAKKELKKAQKQLKKAQKKKKKKSKKSSSSSSSSSSGSIDLEFVMGKEFATGVKADAHNPNARISQWIGVAGAGDLLAFVKRDDDEEIAKTSQIQKQIEEGKRDENGKMKQNIANDWMCQNMVAQPGGDKEVCNARNWPKNDFCFQCKCPRPRDGGLLARDMFKKTKANEAGRGRIL